MTSNLNKTYFMDVSGTGDSWERDEIDSIVVGCKEHGVRTLVRTRRAADIWLLEHHNTSHFSGVGKVKMTVDTNDWEQIGVTPMKAQSFEMTVRRNSLLALFMHSPTGLTINEIAEEFPDHYGETKRNVSADLRWLVAEGHVIGVGAPRYRRYYAVKFAHRAKAQPPEVNERRTALLIVLKSFPAGLTVPELLNEFPDLSRSVMKNNLGWLLENGFARDEGTRIHRRYFAASGKA